VTVNVTLPGPVVTPMMDNLIRYRQAMPDKPEPTRDDNLQAEKDATPMGIAWVKPEDVTAGILAGEAMIPILARHSDDHTTNMTGAWDDLVACSVGTLLTVTFAA
jgi:hypothetical protein